MANRAGSALASSVSGLIFSAVGFSAAEQEPPLSSPTLCSPALRPPPHVSPLSFVRTFSLSAAAQDPPARVRHGVAGACFVLPALCYFAAAALGRAPRTREKAE